MNPNRVGSVDQSEREKRHDPSRLMRNLESSFARTSRKLYMIKRTCNASKAKLRKIKLTIVSAGAFEVKASSNLITVMKKTMFEKLMTGIRRHVVMKSVILTDI